MLSTYLITLLIAFIVITVIALFFNYSRRRLRKTPHGLTGMCHKDGGPMCSSCQDAVQKKNNQT